MKRCSKCLMADTKPGLVLDSEGVCQACRHHENRKNTDWTERQEQLSVLCDKYRRKGSEYDCIIPVSGGKDSHYQVYVMKDLFDMNPLLVNVTDWFTHTEAGKHNFRNISEHFGCDIVQFHLNCQTVKKMMRVAFEEFGSPTWPIDRMIYLLPVRYAIQTNIPLVVYGENVNYEYGGIQTTDTPSATTQMRNDVVKERSRDWWREHGISEQDYEPYKDSDTHEFSVNPIYLSYFTPWDGLKNLEYAKTAGFKTLDGEWEREGYIDDYDQIDSVGYLMNVWMKYLKFGFARVTDVVGYWIRSGKITKEEGQILIDSKDHFLDKWILRDFLKFTGYTEDEFYKIAAKFVNKDLDLKLPEEIKKYV